MQPRVKRSNTLGQVKPNPNLAHSGSEPPREEESGYIMPVNDLERRRLNMQHSVVTRQYGYLLSPEIEVEEDSRILESACGTGIWAIELAAKLPPTVSFECVDLATTNFPAPDDPALPENIQFSKHNILHLPEEWGDTFDIVSQRLLVACLTQSDWLADLKEMYRVIRPGGWIQLIERDTGTFSPDKIAGYDPALSKIVTHMKDLFKKNGLVWLLDDVLPPLLQQIGFINITKHDRIFPLEGAIGSRVLGGSPEEESSLRDDTLTCLIDIVRQFRPNAVKAGWTSSEERYDETVESIRTSWKSIPRTTKGVGFTWHWIVAQKPI